MWLHCHIHYNAELAVLRAAKARHLTVVQWLLDNHNSIRMPRRQRVLKTVVLKTVVSQHESTIEAIGWYNTGDRWITHCVTADHGYLPPRGLWYAYSRIYPLMDWAAEQGNLALLQQLPADPVWKGTLSLRYMEYVSRRGDLEILNWFHEHYFVEGGTNVLISATANNQVAVLEWYNHHYKIRSRATQMYGAAIRGGHIDVIHWLETRFAKLTVLKCPTRTTKVKQGDLDLLKTLHGDPVGTTMCSFRAICRAAERGDLVVQPAQTSQRYWIGCTNSSISLIQSDHNTAAFRSHQFKSLRRLIDHFREIFRHLVSYPLDQLTAASRELNRLVCEVQDRRIDVFAAYSAARKGNIDVLQWLVEEDERGAVSSRLNRETLLSCAIVSGNLELIQWCVEELGDFTSVKYLYQKFQERGDLDRVVPEEQVRSALVEGIRSGKLELAMWCIEDIGVWFDQILGCAACCRSPVVFSYLIRTARERARAGDNALSCVDHDHIMTMFFIRMGVEDEVMEWVLEHCPETGAIRAEKLVRVVSYPVRPWRVMRKMLQYRPALCLPMLKLPLWAVQFGNVADLEHLAALNRPKLFTKKVLKHILQFSRDEAIMSWFLSRLKLDRVDLRVVRWAAKYGSIPILSSLFEDMITNEATRDDSVPLVQFFNTAIWGAIRHDQLNVLDWVGCQEDTGQNRNRLWTFSLANTAAQRGRLAIIRWLLKRGKVSIDQIKELIEIAARHGQIQCLQGLTSLIPRPEDA